MAYTLKFLLKNVLVVYVLVIVTPPYVKKQTFVKILDHLAISRVHVGEIITSWVTPNGKS